MKSKKILAMSVVAIVLTSLFSGCIREDSTAAVGEKYDLTKDKNVEIVLKFNEGESFDSVGDNAKYLHDFWSVYLSKFSDAQSDTIWSIIESRKAALKGRDINAVVVVWGYPDNFNMTLVTEEGNFNYVEKQKLPQPDGFTIMGVGSSFNIQNETCIGDSFQYFLASRLWYDNPSLREEVHPSYTIEEGSIVVCITIVAAVVSVVMTIKQGWDIGKVGKSILETRVHNFENVVKAAETGEIANVKKVDIWVDPFGTPHSIITDEEYNQWDENRNLISEKVSEVSQEDIEGEVVEGEEDKYLSEFERIHDELLVIRDREKGMGIYQANSFQNLKSSCEQILLKEQARTPQKEFEDLHNAFLEYLQYEIKFAEAGIEAAPVEASLNEKVPTTMNRVQRQIVKIGEDPSDENRQELINVVSQEGSERTGYVRSGSFSIRYGNPYTFSSDERKGKENPETEYAEPEVCKKRDRAYYEAQEYLNKVIDFAPSDVWFRRDSETTKEYVRQRELVMRVYDLYHSYTMGRYKNIENLKGNITELKEIYFTEKQMVVPNDAKRWHEWTLKFLEHSINALEYDEQAKIYKRRENERKADSERKNAGVYAGYLRVFTPTTSSYSSWAYDMELPPEKTIKIGENIKCGDFQVIIDDIEIVKIYEEKEMGESTSTEKNSCLRHIYDVITIKVKAKNIGEKTRSLNLYGLGLITSNSDAENQLQTLNYTFYNFWSVNSGEWRTEKIIFQSYQDDGEPVEFRGDFDGVYLAVKLD